MGGRNALSRLAGLANLLSLYLPAVHGHGYLSQPVSRNYFEYLNNRFWNRKQHPPQD